MAAPPKNEWERLSMETRAQLLRDIEARIRPLVDALEIEGANDKVISSFIYKYNQRYEPRLNTWGFIKESAALHDKEGNKPFTGHIEESGNYAEAVIEFTTDPSKYTEEHILKELKIDLDVWRVGDRKLVKKWATAMKDRNKNPVSVPNYSVHIPLVRNKPIKFEWPVIAPIQIDSKFVRHLAKKKQKPIKRNLKCALIIPDSQHGYSRSRATGKLEPYHDRRVWDIAAKMAAKIQPEKIILLGDHLDLPEHSEKFIKQPEFARTTFPAFVELHWELMRLRATCPKAEIVWLEGNHDERFTRYAKMNAAASLVRNVDDFLAEPESMDALSIPKIMGLDRLDIKYVGPYPDGEYWINDNLMAIHGMIVKGSAAATASAHLDRYSCSVIFGHIHQRVLVTKSLNKIGRKIGYMASCPGCTCHIDGRVPSKSSHNNWNQGLQLVQYEDGDGFFNIESLPIFDKKGGESKYVIFRDEIIAGEDHTEQIERDCLFDVCAA